MAVRWYLRFSLSLRDVECLMAERGVSVDHTTVWRWIQRYAPVFEKRLRTKLRCTFAKSGGVGTPYEKLLRVRPLYDVVGPARSNRRRSYPNCQGGESDGAAHAIVRLEQNRATE